VGLGMKHHGTHNKALKAKEIVEERNNAHTTNNNNIEY
jgi:hypothetical protein